MSAPPADVDAYIAEAPPPARPVLEDPREQTGDLLGADVEERISYRVPVFTLGRQVVGMGVTTTHVSLYSMSPPLMARLAPRLRGWGLRVSGATLSVPHGTPFPAEAVRVVVEGRMSELGLRKG